MRNEKIPSLLYLETEETERWVYGAAALHQKDTAFPVGRTGFVSQMLALMADINRERVCQTESGHFCYDGIGKVSLNIMFHIQ